MRDTTHTHCPAALGVLYGPGAQRSGETQQTRPNPICTLCDADVDSLPEAVHRLLTHGQVLLPPLPMIATLPVGHCGSPQVPPLVRTACPSGGPFELQTRTQAG